MVNICIVLVCVRVLFSNLYEYLQSKGMFYTSPTHWITSPHPFCACTDCVHVICLFEDAERLCPWFSKDNIDSEYYQFEFMVKRKFVNGLCDIWVFETTERVLKSLRHPCESSDWDGSVLKCWRHPCETSDWDKVDDIPVRRVTEVEDAGALNWNWVKWLGDASLCTTLNTGVTLLDKQRNASFVESG